MPLTWVNFRPLSSARSVNQSPLTSETGLTPADEAESFGGTASQPAPAAKTRRQKKRAGNLAMVNVTRNKRPAPRKGAGLQLSSYSITRLLDYPITRLEVE